MTLQLGDCAPDFTAGTADGEIRFHEWLGSGWGVLFSHPADFTPVCTTELGTVARLAGQFAARNTKVAAISVDTAESHRAWNGDIEEKQGAPGGVSPHPRSAPPGRAPLRDDPPPPRRHRDGAIGVRHRPRQDGQADADLP